MFKIIKFDPSSLKLYSLIPKVLDEKEHNFVELKTDKILEHENFERTFAGIGLNKILDLEKRSSWTHKLKFRLEFPTEAHEFMKQNNIFKYPSRGYMNDEYDNFTMLKYEPGDFFLNHRDTDMSTYEDGDHKYTCLIFCPFSENNELLEGGELIFKHPEGLYEIKFDPAVETRQNRCVMVIFSIDMYHEVLPIIKGSRWVFKKPLFVKTFTKYTKEKEKKEDTDDEGELCDVGYSYLD